MTAAVAGMVAAVAGLAGWADPTAEAFAVAGRDRAYRLAVRFEVDGRPLGAAWAGALAALFADLDRDGNGRLSKAEAARAPSARRVRQLGWGYLWAVPEPAPWGDLDANRDGAATAAELADYYRRAGAAGVQVVAGTAPPPGPLTDALLRYLDTDRDGAVSRAEWDRAADALGPLDADADELLRPDELVARTTYPGTSGGLTVSRTEPPPGKPRPLTRLPTTSVGASDAAVTLRGGPPPAAVSLPGVRVWAYPAAGRLPDEVVAAARTARERFAALDADRDGAVTRAEAAAGTFAPLRDHHHVADRDGDERVSSAEWDRCLAVRAGLVAACVTVTVLDHGEGLFELLDADGDGTLSVREFRGAWGHLAAAGCTDRGALNPAALPRTVRLVVSRGTPAFLGRVPERGGPNWFRAMDRNRDGDVSAREWVGDVAHFRRLDADKDGLVTTDEATRAPGR